MFSNLLRWRVRHSTDFTELQLRIYVQYIINFTFQKYLIISRNLTVWFLWLCKYGMKYSLSICSWESDSVYCTNYIPKTSQAFVYFLDEWRFIVKRSKTFPSCPYICFCIPHPHNSSQFDTFLTNIQIQTFHKCGGGDNHLNEFNLWLMTTAVWVQTSLFQVIILNFWKLEIRKDSKCKIQDKATFSLPILVLF